MDFMSDGLRISYRDEAPVGRAERLIVGERGLGLLQTQLVIRIVDACEHLTAPHRATQIDRDRREPPRHLGTD